MSTHQGVASKQPASVPAWVTAQGNSSTNATDTTPNQRFRDTCIVFILGGPGEVLHTGTGYP